MCGLSRVVFPAALLGIAVATFAGSATVGWLVAIAVGGVLYLLGRRRFNASCGVSPQKAQPFEGLAHSDEAGEDQEVTTR